MLSVIWDALPFSQKQLRFSNQDAMTEYKHILKNFVSGG
ncbi:hypothetical protein MTBLM5_170002 [Magnetospirillum sp. LM-5]|nr:hypothetical protein MTBLM5_170002 [Magnetospirillum sp. LM-5]